MPEQGQPQFEHDADNDITVAFDGLKAAIDAENLKQEQARRTPAPDASNPRNVLGHPDSETFGIGDAITRQD